MVLKRSEGTPTAAREKTAGESSRKQAATKSQVAIRVRVQVEMRVNSHKNQVVIGTHGRTRSRARKNSRKRLPQVNEVGACVRAAGQATGQTTAAGWM